MSSKPAFAIEIENRFEAYWMMSLIDDAPKVLMKKLSISATGERDPTKGAKNSLACEVRILPRSERLMLLSTGRSEVTDEFPRLLDSLLPFPIVSVASKVRKQENSPVP